MTRIMGLATALALFPAYALANKPQPLLSTSIPFSALRVPIACTPAHPCAMPASPGAARIRAR